MKSKIILATYLVNHVKSGAYSNYETGIFQTSESVEIPSTDMPIGDIKRMFEVEMDKKFGIDKWALGYFLGIKEVDSLFFVEKSELTTLEGKLFLKGIGKYKGHCHTLDSVKWLLGNEIFIKRHIAIVPFFQVAKEMMENGQVGYVRPIKESHGQMTIYEP